MCNFVVLLKAAGVLKVAEIEVSVVQWIEFRIPVPTIRVRLPTGIQKPDLEISGLRV